MGLRADDSLSLLTTLLINVSSVNALWSIGEFGYSAAKAGLISFTKNVAVTYGAQGIRANVICPGTIATERGGAYWDQKSGAKEKLLKWYPLGRLGQPEDVAHLALYLASSDRLLPLCLGVPAFGKFWCPQDSNL